MASPTMKAFRFTDHTTGLQLHDDIPIPSPGPGQALIAVRAAGLCHSDAHVLSGDGDAWVLQRPITLGHEVAGVIIKLGPSPTPHAFAVGDAVAIALISQPRETAIEKTAVGIGYDGGYAAYALGQYEHLVRVPERVSLAQAAVATDSISTAYHAVVGCAEVAEGMTVGIVGLGGLGMNGVRVATLRGAKVYGVDVNEGKFAEARAQGAVACAASLKGFGDVVFDVVIDFAGVNATVGAAVEAVKVTGVVVLVGLGAAKVEISPSVLVRGNISLKGSIGASKEDLESVLELVAEGKIVPKLREIPFEDIPKGLKDLEKNNVEGRLFACPNPGNLNGVASTYI